MKSSSLGFPTRRLVSQENQSMIARPDVPRSTFTGRRTRLTTFNAGYLVPFLVDEILPADHMKYRVAAYVRMATPLFPIFSNFQIDTFFFFVPNRIVWTDWKKMMGELPPTGDSPDNYSVPQVVSDTGGFPANSIYDHMGITVVGQTGAGENVSVNALPFRMYNLIYNQWFRDENIIAAAIERTGAGPDTDTDYTLRLRAKAHDYFTSCLPWPQKFTAPTIPLIGDAPVYGIGITPTGGEDGSAGTFAETGNAGGRAYAHYKQTAGGITGNQTFIEVLNAGGAGQQPLIYADLTAVAGVSINELRESFLIQQLLERDARGGTRYTEILKSHFGVTSPDMRLQRPEYIGGGSSQLTITPIAQTAPDGAGDGLGNLGGAGTAIGQHSATYAATEHGFIIGLINIRSELAYQQGIEKQWMRRTRYDYYWPSLAGLGEQAVLRGEIYNTGAPANDDVVFGYQERWQEYRQPYSTVTGMFRSTTTAAIDQWHAVQDFGTAPTLSQAFIEDTPPMDRILAAGSAASTMQFLADILIDRSATRAIPAFGTPVTLGRF